MNDENCSIKTKKSICNNLIDHLVAIPLKKAISYFFWYILLFFSLKFMLLYFGFNDTDIDSARYMLSTLIQSEATIFAIVVSLSLIAVQQASSSYSTRVIRIFKRNPHLWILIIIYIISIIYEVWVLKSIRPFGTSQDSVHTLQNFSHTIFFSSFEDHILFSFSLGIFSFLILVPYIISTLNLLDPSNIINILSKDITKDNLFSLNESSKRIGDPVLPIIDIVNSSLLKYDYETVKYGLGVIENRIICVINEIDSESDEIRKTLLNIIHYFTGVAKVAANLKNEESANYAVKSIGKIGAVLSQKEFNNTTNEIAGELHKLGIKLAQEKMGLATLTSIDSLEKIKSITFEQEITPAKAFIIWNIVLDLGYIGREVVKSNIDHLSILHAFKKTADTLVEKNIQNKDIISFYILSILGFGKSLLIHINDAENAFYAFHEIYFSLTTIIKLPYKQKITGPYWLMKGNLEYIKETTESDPRYQKINFQYIVPLISDVDDYLKLMGCDPDEGEIDFEGTVDLS